MSEVIPFESEENVVAADPVRTYLNSIAKTPLLNAEQEVDLSKRIEAGLFARHVLEGRLDIPELQNVEGIELSSSSDSLKDNLSFSFVGSVALQDELLKERSTIKDLMQVERQGEQAYSDMIEANLRLVVSIAKKYTGLGMPFLDLIQEGNIGLVHAVKKFDYKQGNKFSTYATWWIRQAITRSLADQARIIRLPVHTVEKINRLRRIKIELTHTLGRDPTDEELGLESGVSVSVLREYAENARRIISLNEHVGDERSIEIGDLLPDDNLNPAEAVVIGLQHEDLLKFIDQLDRREQLVLSMLYGLYDDKPKSLDLVAKSFGLSRRTIRTIEKRALCELRKSLESFHDDVGNKVARSALPVVDEVITVSPLKRQKSVTFRSLTPDQFEAFKEALYRRDAASLGVTEETLGFLKLRFSGLYAGDIAKQTGGRSSAISLAIEKGIRKVAKSLDY